MEVYLVAKQPEFFPTAGIFAKTSIVTRTHFLNTAVDFWGEHLCKIKGSCFSTTSYKIDATYRFDLGSPFYLFFSPKL
jgi:hypothetical protein